MDAEKLQDTKEHRVVPPSPQSSVHEKENYSGADDPIGQEPQRIEDYDAEAKAAVASAAPPGSAPTPGQGHVNDLSSVPNGGFRAWLQVVGAFMLFFNTW
jgi:hypothetical protein